MMYMRFTCLCFSVPGFLVLDYVLVYLLMKMNRNDIYLFLGRISVLVRARAARLSSSKVKYSEWKAPCPP